MSVNPTLRSELRSLLSPWGMLAAIPLLMLVAGAFSKNPQILVLAIVASVLIWCLGFFFLRSKAPFENPVHYSAVAMLSIAAGFVGLGVDTNNDILFQVSVMTAWAILVIVYIFPRGNPIFHQMFGNNAVFPQLAPFLHSGVVLIIAFPFFFFPLELLVMNSDGKLPVLFVWLAICLALVGGIFFSVAFYHPRFAPTMRSVLGESFPVVRPYMVGLTIIIVALITMLSALTMYVQFHPRGPQKSPSPTQRAAI